MMPLLLPLSSSCSLERESPPPPLSKSQFSCSPNLFLVRKAAGIWTTPPSATKFLGVEFFFTHLTLQEEVGVGP